VCGCGCGCGCGCDSLSLSLSSFSLPLPFSSPCRCFNALTDQKFTFHSEDFSNSAGKQLSARLQNDWQAPVTLELKVRSQVILLTNLSVNGRLVNGSRGVVIDFVSYKTADIGKPTATKLRW
jgi:hypothetical protein